MRKAFVLYTSDLELMEKLDFTQRGILITAIANYASDRPLPEMDPATDMLFAAIRKQLDRDNEKYERKVARLNDNVSKSNRNRNDIGSVAVAVADAVAVNNTRAKRGGRNKRPAEQHDYDFQKIEADLIKRQREGLRE